MATPWRPCCGACRSERLKRGRVGWLCLDCHSEWDGSELTITEAAERPPAPPASAPDPDEQSA